MMALIDADILVYRCAFASQKNYYEIRENETDNILTTFDTKRELNTYVDQIGIDENSYIHTKTHVEPKEFCLHNIKLSITQILEATRATDYKLFLTGEGNFRKKIAKLKKYKGHREAIPRPIHYSAAREYLTNVWGAEIVDGMEADDKLGIESCKVYETCICSNDKDLDQIVGWHYNFVQDKLYYVTEVQAERCFWKQMLQGDTSDNIPGIPGVGERKAEDYINKIPINKTYEQYVKELYELHFSKPELNKVLVELGYTWQDVFNEHYGLLKIKTHNDEFDE